MHLPVFHWASTGSFRLMHIFLNGVRLKNIYFSSVKKVQFSSTVCQPEFIHWKHQNLARSPSNTKGQFSSSVHCAQEECNPQYMSGIASDPILSKSSCDKSVFLPLAPALSYGWAIFRRNCMSHTHTHTEVFIKRLVMKGFAEACAGIMQQCHLKDWLTSRAICKAMSVLKLRWASRKCDSIHPGSLERLSWRLYL